MTVAEQAAKTVILNWLENNASREEINLFNFDIRDAIMDRTDIAGIISDAAANGIILAVDITTGLPRWCSRKRPAPAE